MAAKTKSIDIAQLDRRARQALAKLPWWSTADLPASYQRPGVYQMLITGLAGELPRSVASSKEFQSAMSAVEAWSAATRLAETAAELYYDPAIRQLTGSPDNLRWLLENPDEAQRLLIEHSVSNPQHYRDSASPLARALAGLAEYSTFSEVYGDGADASLGSATGPVERVAPAQVPSESRIQKAEAGAEGSRTRDQKPAGGDYDLLVAKASLTKAEYQQLLAWTAEDLKIEEAIQSMESGNNE